MRKRKYGKGLMVLKLDLEKAYNRLSWDFILDFFKGNCVTRLPNISYHEVCFFQCYAIVMEQRNNGEIPSQ